MSLPSFAAVTCAIVLATAATGHAEPAGDDSALRVPDKARRLAERGRQLQREGQFAAALEAYKAAYVLAPSAGLLFNLAQAYRLSGDCDDATWMYRRFLETDPRADLRALVEQHLSALSACTHAGFRSRVDRDRDELAYTTAAAQPTPTTRDALADHAAPRTGPPAGRGLRRAGASLLIGGGVALAVAAVFAIDASMTSNDITNAYQGGASQPDLRALDERGHRDDLITASAGITGGLAVISGAVLYGLGWRAETARHVALLPHRDGGEVRVAWQF